MSILTYWVTVMVTNNNMNIHRQKNKTKKQDYHHKIYVSKSLKMDQMS